jgi:hypothetical protein
MNFEENEKLRKIISQAESLENRFRIGSKTDSFLGFGLCKDCGNFAGSVTRFDKKYAKCMELTGMKMDTADPVIYCTIYYKKGQLDIHTLKDMATMIEIGRPIGFLKDEKGEDEDGEKI